MKFWQAMRIVDEGGKVRRELWMDGIWIAIIEGRVMENDPRDKEMYVYQPASSDMTDSDWEVADPCECEDKNAWSTELNGKCLHCEKWRQVE